MIEELRIGSVISVNGFIMLKGLDGGCFYKVVAIDDYSVTFQRSNKNGRLVSKKMVRHYSSSIESKIACGKREDLNNIIVINY